jgi:predicted HTH transcriptional regulator
MSATPEIKPAANAIPEEGQTVERKESLGERREIVETCAAFATAQGGRIYIGVRDNGQVVGVHIGRGTLETLANDIAQNTVPKLVPAITMVKESGPVMIVVEVAESPFKPVTAYGRAYRRSGRTNQVLSANDIAELYFATRGVTWDETTRPDEFIDMKVLGGDLIEQVEDAMAFVRRHTSMAAKIHGAPERKEDWEYPLEALREAIINAICHRDYASSGNVQIRIFRRGRGKNTWYEKAS